MDGVDRGRSHLRAKEPLLHTHGHARYFSRMDMHVTPHTWTCTRARMHARTSASTGKKARIIVDQRRNSVVTQQTSPIIKNTAAPQRKLDSQHPTSLTPRTHIKKVERTRTHSRTSGLARFCRALPCPITTSRPEPPFSSPPIRAGLLGLRGVRGVRGVWGVLATLFALTPVC